MAEDAVPGSQTQPKTARRVRYFSLPSRYAIVGAAIGVPLGWLFAIVFLVRLGPEYLFGFKRLYYSYWVPSLVTNLGGLFGLLGMFCGLVVGVGASIRRKMRRAQRARTGAGPPDAPAATARPIPEPDRPP